MGTLLKPQPVQRDVRDPGGDFRHTWDPNKVDEVKNAERMFNDLINSGQYYAYEEIHPVKGPDACETCKGTGRKPENGYVTERAIIRKFNPQACSIVFRNRQVGG